MRCDVTYKIYINQSLLNHSQITIQVARTANLRATTFYMLGDKELPGKPFYLLFKRKKIKVILAIKLYTFHFELSNSLIHELS